MSLKSVFKCIEGFCSSRKFTPFTHSRFLLSSPLLTVDTESVPQTLCCPSLVRTFVSPVSCGLDFRCQSVRNRDRLKMRPSHSRVTTVDKDHQFFPRISFEKVKKDNRVSKNFTKHLFSFYIDSQSKPYVPKTTFKSCGRNTDYRLRNDRR